MITNYQIKALGTKLQTGQGLQTNRLLHVQPCKEQIVNKLRLEYQITNY